MTNSKDTVGFHNLRRTLRRVFYWEPFHMAYTPEDWHGTYSWRFGRAFSFLHGLFAGSMLIFQGVNDWKNGWLLNTYESWDDPLRTYLRFAKVSTKKVSSWGAHECSSTNRLQLRNLPMNITIFSMKSTFYVWYFDRLLTKYSRLKEYLKVNSTHRSCIPRYPRHPDISPPAPGLQSRLSSWTPFVAASSRRRQVWPSRPPFLGWFPTWKFKNHGDKPT